MLPDAASQTDEELHNTTFTPEGAGLLLAGTMITRSASPPDEVYARASTSMGFLGSWASLNKDEAADFLSMAERGGVEAVRTRRAPEPDPLCPLGLNDSTRSDPGRLSQRSGTTQLSPELTLWNATLDVRPRYAAGQTQPARPGDTWNFKGYLSAAWHRVRLKVE